MEMMKCPRCGAENSVKRQACYNCGTLLHPGAPEPDPMLAAPEPPPPATPNQPQPPAEPVPVQVETPLGDAFHRGFFGCAGAGCFLVALFIAMIGGCAVLMAISSGR